MSWYYECGCWFDNEQFRFLDVELMKENEKLLDQAWYNKYHQPFPWRRGPISRRQT